MGKAKCYRAYSMFEDSIKECEKIFAIDPFYWEAYYYCALLYIQMNQTEKALDSLLIVEKFNPNFSEAYHLIALIYERNQDFDNAVQYYVKYIKKCKTVSYDILDRVKELRQSMDVVTGKRLQGSEEPGTSFRNMRQYFRLPLTRFLSLKVNQEKSVPTLLTDISAGGGKILLADELIDTGDKVQLTIPLYEDKKVDVNGDVVWIKDANHIRGLCLDFEYMAGIKFEKVNSSIDNFVNWSIKGTT
jgi:tetratricopeptide (TPR) repeat protein